MASNRTTVGPRGRVTLPVAVRREAGINEGDEVIVQTTAPGVVTVQTPQALVDSIRAGISPDTDRDSLDATAEIRALRDGKAGPE